MTEAPTYVGLFPWMAQWWLDHLDVPPLLVIRCGSGKPRCRNAVGEIKRDGDRVLAMNKNEYPELDVDWTPLAAPTVEELAAEIAERDAQALRYVGHGPGDDSKIVYKRTALPREVAPLEDLCDYVCREHGVVEVDVEALAAAVREADTPRRTYWATP